MEKYVSRMCDESKEIEWVLEQINERTGKLSVFITENPKFNELDEEQQKLMKRQYEAMLNVVDNLALYRNIVDKRIGLALSK